MFMNKYVHVQIKKNAKINHILFKTYSELSLKMMLLVCWFKVDSSRVFFNCGQIK